MTLIVRTNIVSRVLPKRNKIKGLWINVLRKMFCKFATATTLALHTHCLSVFLVRNLDVLLFEVIIKESLIWSSQRNILFFLVLPKIIQCEHGKQRITVAVLCTEAIIIQFGALLKVQSVCT